jgi:Zn-dependent peptidase ImmA (M78 family)
MSRQTQELEQEANLFACLLLMPSKFIKQDLENLQVDLGGVRKGGEDELMKLCKKYGVSLTALTYRIAYFKKHKY